MPANNAFEPGWTQYEIHIKIGRRRAAKRQWASDVSYLRRSVARHTACVWPASSLPGLPRLETGRGLRMTGSN